MKFVLLNSDENMVMLLNYSDNHDILGMTL